MNLPKYHIYQRVRFRIRGQLLGIDAVAESTGIIYSIRAAENKTAVNGIHHVDSFQYGIIKKPFLHVVPDSINWQIHQDDIIGVFNEEDDR